MRLFSWFCKIGHACIIIETETPLGIDLTQTPNCTKLNISSCYIFKNAQKDDNNFRYSIWDFKV